MTRHGLLFMPRVLISGSRLPLTPAPVVDMEITYTEEDWVINPRLVHIDEYDIESVLDGEIGTYTTIRLP